MNNQTIVKEPFVRIRRRGTTSFLYRSMVRIFAIFFAMLIATWFLEVVADMKFAEIWKYLIDGATVNETTRQEYWKEVMLLLLIALALTPAFKMKFWNIGGQGQVLIGALATSVVMFYGKGMSNSGMILLSFVFSIVAGGIWAAIPAIFKVKLNANETLFTLMMNYLAIQLVAASIDAWKGKNSALPQFNTDTRLGYLPSIGDNTYGIIMICVLVITVILYLYMKHTKQGYEISVVGESLKTARYAGMNTTWIIIRTVFLSGALCGLCGFFYVAGSDYLISTTTSGSYGFTAIIVSWAASFNPFGMLILSIIMTFMSKGTLNVVNYASSTLNQYTAYITVGILLFFLIGCEFFIQYRMVFNSKLQAKFDTTSEKIHKAMPWWFTFWKKVSDGIDMAISAVQKWISEILAKIKAALVKLFNKNAPVQPEEPEEAPVVKDEKEVGIHD
ncbi:MAG: ABC transporter permease [Clostridiales bacterium]|nr:ABC transporter permease [Clostridiales bacterium]